MNDVRRAELAVIHAAMADHRGGCAPETCGGSRHDPCRLENAIDLLRTTCAAVWRAELVWHPRTWADVRPGDTVRLPGTEVTAEIYTAVRLDWNIDPRTGTSGYNPPVALPHSVIRVRFTHEEIVRDMDLAKPVEIQLTRSEVEALDAVGWHNRERLIIEEVG